MVLGGFDIAAALPVVVSLRPCGGGELGGMLFGSPLGGGVVAGSGRDDDVSAGGGLSAVFGVFWSELHAKAAAPASATVSIIRDDRCDMNDFLCGSWSRLVQQACRRRTTITKNR